MFVYVFLVHSGRPWCLPSIVSNGLQLKRHFLPYSYLIDTSMAVWIPHLRLLIVTRTPVTSEGPWLYTCRGWPISSINNSNNNSGWSIPYLSLSPIPYACKIFKLGFSVADSPNVSTSKNAIKRFFFYPPQKISSRRNKPYSTPTPTNLNPLNSLNPLCTPFSIECSMSETKCGH